MDVIPPLDRETVVLKVAGLVKWWISERIKKFSELGHGSMTVNPFMAPVVIALHSHIDFTALANMLIDGHFMLGHATGFGKLIDEKILPRVFRTTKLDKAFRRSKPYDHAAFSEIDHLVITASGGISYLSLKQSRWTIQLTMAKEMNASFKILLDKRDAGEIPGFDKIVVGVIYGTNETLTDKFSIIRGICTVRSTAYRTLRVMSMYSLASGFGPG